MRSTTLLLPAWKAALQDASKPKKLIPRDVRTRWNSTYDMLSVAYDHRELLDNFVDVKSHDLRKFALSKEEWEIVRQLREVLKVRAWPPQHADSCVRSDERRASCPPPAAACSTPFSSPPLSESYPHCRSSRTQLSTSRAMPPASGPCSRRWIISTRSLPRHASTTNWGTTRLSALHSGSPARRSTATTVSRICPIPTASLSVSTLCLLVVPYSSCRTVLHAGKKLAFFRAAKWPEAWIEGVITLARDAYETYPEPDIEEVAGPTTPASRRNKVGISSDTVASCDRTEASAGRR